MTKPSTTDDETRSSVDEQQRSEHAQHPSRIPWPPILLVAVTIAAIVLDGLVPIDWPGLNDMPAQIIGIAIGAGGVLLAIWSIVTLLKAQTTVLPHKAAAQLVTSGPYARLRNPIYVADVMMVLGLAELTKNIWLVAGAVVFAGCVTLLAILPEERHLEARFGDAYRAYKARSRRWL